MTELESLCAALEEQRKRPYPRCCALFVVGSLSASSDAGDCADAPSDGPAGRIRWKINFWWSEKGPILTNGEFKFCVDGVCFFSFLGELFGLTGHFGKIKKNTHTHTHSLSLSQNTTIKNKNKITFYLRNSLFWCTHKFK
jgi:hypothetical protein